jgi:exodeoxyribonuclease V alpha subunit
VDFLAADLVICDETSMVDVALLGELLRALSPATRIVLVGDPNQLQSVDAGSAMGDIVAAMRHGDVAGVELTVVRRVSGSNRDVLLQLFDAVRRGASDEAMALIEAGVTGVSWAPLTSDESNVPQDVLRPVVERAERLRSLASNPAVREEDIERELTSVMVLTAQHHGDFGRHWWVRHVADTLGVNTGGSPRDVGVPVLVTQTDRGANLVNGDDGIVRATPEGDLVFDTMGSFPVRLRPAAVTHWQPWYAMTIHKSQGSEFQRVVVSVTPGTRLLSRELLYTALTRAKEEVTIVATPDDLRLAIERPVVRLTGLADALHRAATVI